MDAARGGSLTDITRGEDAAPERLKALRAEGLGFARIAARMSSEGIPTRTGRPWHGVVINRILTGKPP